MLAAAKFITIWLLGRVLRAFADDLLIELFSIIAIVWAALFTVNLGADVVNHQRLPLLNAREEGLEERGGGESLSSKETTAMMMLVAVAWLASTDRIAIQTFATMATATNLQTYKFNHSMIRVKDPKESVKFYEFLGMKMIRKIEQPEAKFDLYFLGYDSPQAVSHGNHFSDREGLIELTHNYGTEDDPEYKVSTGNSEPHKGFGHTCISVDNIQAACQRIEDAGYKFQKKLTDGRMRSIAFALDPDGYWVEIIGQNPVDKTEAIKTTNLETYRMNHTMIRIKDQEKSLKFYKEVFGMTLLRTSENKDANFNLYFLGYPGEKGFPDSSANGVNPTADREGLLELTWNYGTEKDVDFKYHNGNDQPQGFGHICVSVDDLDAACKRFEELGVNWKKRLTDGRMKSVAFILDPDNYWIEIIQNEKLKSRANW